MANSPITPSIIAKVGLANLENELVMGKKVYRDYSKEFVKVGDTISVRRPVQFTAQDGATAITQDVTEGKFSLQIASRKHVAWKFSTQDLTLSIEEYNARYIQPAALALANQIDYDLCGLYNKVWNWVGTPGQVINSFTDFAKAPERLDIMAVPGSPRHAVLSPSDNWGLAGSAASLYIQKTAEGAYRKGDVGELGSIMTNMDQNIRTHTVGTYGGTPRVNGANQNVTYATAKDTNTQTLITDGWSSGATTLKAGDVFTIANVYSVNPRSKATTGILQQFVVQADISDTTGGITMTVAPAMITSGAYQTIDSVPADDALITMLGTSATAYTQNLVFHKNAFALVMCDLEMPDGAVFKARESQNGYSLRVIKYYDGTTDEEKIRLDVLYGIKGIYPDLATRASGTA